MNLKDKHYRTLNNIDNILKNYFTFTKDYKTKFVSLYDFIKNHNEKRCIKKMELFDFKIHIKFLKVRDRLDIDLKYISKGYNVLTYSCSCPLYLNMDNLKRFVDKKTNQLDDNLVEYLLEDLCIFMYNFLSQER